MDPSLDVHVITVMLKCLPDNALLLPQNVGLPNSVGVCVGSVRTRRGSLQRCKGKGREGETILILFYNTI